jgi:hypothetical protein
LRREFACDREDECQFPYLHLSDYLDRRGLHHMSWFVRWDGVGRENHRSKFYINLLKVRLSIYAPDSYGLIARNEAHVRLMSSTWYMGRTLMKLAKRVTLAYFVVLLALSWCGMVSLWPAEHVLEHLRPLIPAAVAVGATFLTRRSIEAALHYQRLREILYVVETANVVYEDHPGKIRHVFPQFTKNPVMRQIVQRSADHSPADASRSR